MSDRDDRRGGGNSIDNTVSCFVGGVPPRASESEILDFFRKFQPVKAVIKNGFAFVQFRDDRDARDCATEFRECEFMGSKLRVEVAKPREERGRRNGGDRDSRDNRNHNGAPALMGGRSKGQGFRVEIENLNQKTSWQDLKDFARACGTVTFTDVWFDHKSNQKMGIMEYAHEGDMRRALDDLDGKTLDDNTVKLFEDRAHNETVRERKRQNGGSAGGSDRRDRERDRDRDRDRDYRRDSRSPRRHSSPPSRRYRSRSRSRDRSRDRRDRTPPRRERERSPFRDNRDRERERDRDSGKDRDRKVYSPSPKRERSPVAASNVKERERSRSPVRSPPRDASAPRSDSPRR